MTGPDGRGSALEVRFRDMVRADRQPASLTPLVYMDRCLG